MPKKVDPNTRRHQLAEAIWRITRRDGWDAVSLRHVATEAGVSMGMVQHYFTSKDQMLQFAMQTIADAYTHRITTRITALPTPRQPRQVVQIILEELLPNNTRGQVEVQAAAAFLSRAILHPEIATPLITASTRLTTYIADQITLANPTTPSTTATLNAATLLALTDGLIAHHLTGRLPLPTVHQILTTQLSQIFTPTHPIQQ